MASLARRAIDSEEFRFITLELENLEGDIIGSLSTNAHNRILEVHANVGVVFHHSEYFRTPRAKSYPYRRSKD